MRRSEDRPRKRAKIKAKELTKNDFRITVETIMKILEPYGDKAAVRILAAAWVLQTATDKQVEIVSRLMKGGSRCDRPQKG